MFLLTIVNITAQQTPASKQAEPISIEGATAHLGNGEVIENSLVMFREGKIIFVQKRNNKILFSANRHNVNFVLQSHG